MIPWSFYRDRQRREALVRQLLRDDSKRIREGLQRAEHKRKQTRETT